jgi:hypothetical protein
MKFFDLQARVTKIKITRPLFHPVCKAIKASLAISPSANT